MSETKNIHTDAGWYTSYEDSQQGKALIICQQKKILQLQSIIDNINAETELADEPKDYDAEMVLQSIKQLSSNIPIVSHTEGYFKWEG